MMVPWPWIKARHPVRGHGCFRFGPRGGHPLERAYRNFIHAIRGCGLPVSKFFLDVGQGDSWQREVKWVCTS